MCAHASMKDEFDPHCAHLDMFWSPKKVHEVEQEHRSIRVLYESGDGISKAVDSTYDKCD